MSFKFRKIEKKDSIEICNLYKIAFNKPMSRINESDIFFWFYFKNVNKKHYSFLMENKNRIISYWGFIPVSYIINNNILSGSLSFQLVSVGETLGSTLSLWKKIKNEMQKDNISLSFTINHENSALLLKRLGWISTPTPILISFLSILRLANDMLINKIKSKIFAYFCKIIFLSIDSLFLKIKCFFEKQTENVSYTKKFGSSFQEILTEINKNIKFGVSLNSDYLNWRYCYKPDRDYKILKYTENNIIKGYLIYKVEYNYGTKIGYIMDIIVKPKNGYIVDNLIHFVKKELRIKKVTFISILAFKNNLFYDSIKKAYFFSVLKNLLPHRSYFSLIKHKNFDDKIKIDNWNISWGNHDNV